ncbi:MAG: type III-B CRISPR module RAMP protein Cmr6 [Salinisphaera sp.]|nr:type III-B CRISPR module RAMP protein Cmr6 [Salinisphaera sp.]
MAPAADLPVLPDALARAVAAMLGPDAALAPNANPGLVFERYPRCWSGRNLDLGRKDFLLRFVEDYQNLRTVFEPRLAAHRHVLDRLHPVEQARSYHARERFVTGLGADHSLENGFTFHRHLGVPYFPGTAVKGLTRAAARLSGIEPDGDEERRLFGAVPSAGPEKQPGGQSGAFIFLDALPAAWPELGVDLINNHRPTWTALVNSGAQIATPNNVQRASAAGLENPVPVFFLVVEPKAEIRFWLAPRPGARQQKDDLEQVKDDLEQVWGWLELGLKYLGIGAKTAVGYGRLTDTKPADQSAGGGTSPTPSPLIGGTRVQFVLTGQSKKGKWQGHLEGEPSSFGTVSGSPPPDVAPRKIYQVIVVAGGDRKNLNLRWPP